MYYHLLFLFVVDVTMIISLSIFNSIGSRLYHIQCLLYVPLRDYSSVVSGEERKDVLKCFSLLVLDTEYKVSTPFVFDDCECYHCTVGGCWFVSIVDHATYIDTMSLSYIVDAIAKVIPINEVSIIRNATLVDTVMNECIGDGMLHTVDYFNILSDQSPSIIPTKQVEMMQCSHPPSPVFYPEEVEFKTHNRHLKVPTYYGTDRYMASIVEPVVLRRKVVTLDQREEVNMVMSRRGELLSSNLSGAITVSSCSCDVMSIQLLFDTLTDSSAIKNVTINQCATGSIEDGVLTVKDIYGKIPVMSYTALIKTYPMRLSLSLRTEEERHRLIVSIDFSVTGKTRLHSLSCRVPNTVRCVESSSPTSSCAPVSFINGDTACILLDTTYEKESSGTVTLICRYADDAEPLTTDVPFLWANFTTTYTVSDFSPRVIIDSRSEEETSLHYLRRTVSGSYGVCIN